MQIRDSYLVYTPAPEMREATPQPLTREAWSHEMNEWVRLHDAAQTPFTEVPQPVETPPPDPVSATAAQRGVLLRSDRILKSDQYPGLHRMNLNQGSNPQPRISGAPNYRQIDGENIHGVAQPTVDGIKGVLDQVGKGPGQGGPPAVWTNLREEPVVYVNGRPLNLRVANDWTRNIENPGATTSDVEHSDTQLKADVLAEAAKNGGRLLVHDEGPDGKLVSRWEEVKPEGIQTPREVFDGLKAQGYNVDYARIPVADEKSPEPRDFDALVQRLKNTTAEQPAIFNCHAGRGRTTTGMVMAGLLRRAQHGGGDDERITREPAVREDIKETGGYRTGEYRVILSLIRTLERGPKSKKEADAVINQYSGLLNLRESILEYKEKAETLPDASARLEAKERGQQYLERYFNLIAFDAYAKDQAPKGFAKPFQTWLKEHPALPRLLDNVQLSMGFTEKPDGATAYA